MTGAKALEPYVAFPRTKVRGFHIQD